jgi:hypothetical protein
VFNAAFLYLAESLCAAVGTQSSEFACGETDSCQGGLHKAAQNQIVEADQRNGAPGTELLGCL